MDTLIYEKSTDLILFFNETVEFEFEAHSISISNLLWNWVGVRRMFTNWNDEDYTFSTGKQSEQSNTIMISYYKWMKKREEDQSTMNSFLLIIASLFSSVASQCGSTDNSRYLIIMNEREVSSPLFRCGNYVANGFCSNTAYTLLVRQATCGTACGLCGGCHFLPIIRRGVFTECNDTMKLDKDWADIIVGTTTTTASCVGTTENAKWVGERERREITQSFQLCQLGS